MKLIYICVSSGTDEAGILVDKKDLERMTLEIEKENRLFAKKANLGTLTYPSQIIGREDNTKELVRFLTGYKQGLVVPFISVFGRSGSGKSTVTRFVCENLKGLSHRLVNLRKAKTVFGCANLILGEVGEPSLKSAQGINMAVDKIGNAIAAVAKKEKSNCLFWCSTSLTYYFMTKGANHLISFTSC